MASEMVMPTPTPEPPPARFSEGDPWVLSVYFLTFAIWTAAAGNDFISSTWKSVRTTRQRGKFHVALVFIPMPLITAYIVFQVKKDYKEMGTALVALLFAGFHLLQTLMGLWQLHMFKQWTMSAIMSMESLGFKTRLQAVAAPSAEEADSDEEEGDLGSESESGATEERKGGEISGEENVTGAQAGVKSSGGRSSGGSGGSTQQRGCWFPGFLKNVPFLTSKGAEWERIERIAGDVLVNDTLIDNRLSDVHTVCKFRFLSKDEEKTVRSVRLPSKDEMKTVKGALKGARLTLKRIYLRIWYGFPRALCVFRVFYSLAFPKNPHVPNLNSAPRLVPRRPESIWLNWAAALVAQAGWIVQDTVLVDPDTSAGYTENRNRYAEQVLLSAALHTRRMTAAKTSTSGSNEDGDRMSGFLSFRDWHKYPELCNGKFSKQEWLKRACKSGNGLPYQAQHRQAKETKDRWGYGNFKSELVRAREALPPELESRVKNFDVEQLEWFAIFVSIENWAPWCPGTEKEGDMENKDDIPSDCSKSSSDSRGDVEEDNVELENDIPFENLKKQLGFDNQISCIPGPEQKEGEPENRPENRLGCTTEPNLQKQLGNAKESNFVLGSFKLPYMRNLLRANLWGNRNVLEVSCHVDNWIALCAGEQTSYMVESVSKMEEDLKSANEFRSIDRSVAACATFENCRFLCQMAIIRPEHKHFDKSITFLGCSMEMLRSSLARWAEANGHSEEGTWRPRLFSNGILRGTSRSEGLGRWEGSDDFTSCFRSLKSLAAMSRSFVKMRVLWELQNRFQTHLQKNEFTPNSLEAIALCIMSFPAVSVKLRDRREPSAIARFVEGVEERIEVFQRREECIVAVHGGGEESFGIENYEYVICSSSGPQDLQLILTFEALQEKSNIVLSMLLCEMEGRKVDYFDWEVWRNAFYGRVEACRQWKAKVGISNLALIAPTERINAGIQKVSSSLAAVIPESGTGTEMCFWKGWPPHCTSICMYELTTEEFILQPREVEGVSLALSMGEGTTFQIKIPQVLWGPVKYAEANESSFRKACLVAQNLLTGTEDIGLAYASDTDVIIALRAAVEQEIFLLQSNVGKTEAVLRGVALLERFYVYGTHRPGTKKRNTVNLSSFFRNENYVKVVSSLFERMFEASEYDECVAERYQRFLMFGVLHGEEASRENAIRVMFRSIVYRCYYREVAESAATFLVAVLPSHSNGSFEEYAALILAYMNARKEIEAALQRRTGRDSLLEGVRHVANVRLGIVIRSILKKEGGRQFLEALGLSAHDTAKEAVVELSLSESPGVYRPSTIASTPTNTVSLDFDTTDEMGMPATPEGSLKHTVLSSVSPEVITAAAGALNPAFGVVGMGGVGKTIALQGLTGDEDIRARFPDGIQYMRLGQGAAVQHAIKEIARTMTMTGATTSAAKVEHSTSIRDAVDYAATWFQGKKCLFLVDDVWPTDRSPTGFLTDLRQLMRGSRDSRMVISTRSVNIARAAGPVVDFGPRNLLGSASLAILMRSAGNPFRENEEGISPSVAKILTWGGGLPIFLVVAGSTVSLLVRKVGGFKRACEIYVIDFEEMETKLREEDGFQGTRMSYAIRLGLKYLDIEFLEWKERQAVDTKHTISDLYTSLCVLTNQVWIPVSVLSRMWQLCEKSALAIVDLFCGLGLATLSFRRIRDGTVEKAGLNLHDLHLEFCKQQAGREKTELMWHSALLSGHLDAPSDAVFSDPCTLSSPQLLDVTPRSWWTIPEDDYIHANLARHLSFSERGAELAVLLLDARWAHVRGTLGGILGLKADFEILDELLERGGSGDGESNRSKGIRKSFQLVRKAMQLSWGSFSDGRRALQFQMYGRLLTLRNNDVIIDSVIKSFEAHTPKPYLMPVSRFFPELNSAQVLETPVGGWCGWLDRSPCGRYVAAGAGCDIVVADLMTGDVLKRLNGHLALVDCVRFTAGSQKIVSASEDRTVAVWEWEESDTPILVLEGHSDEVTSVDISSDGKFVVSGSRDCTVRLWNGLTGLQTGEFMQSSEVICVSLCSEDKKVAVGLCNGTVKVLDSCTGDTLFEDTEAHTEIVTCVAFSPDGGRMATCSWDKTIRIWDTEKWAAIGSPVEGHAKAVSSVAFSPDWRQLVSGSLDGSISLWDVAPAEYAGASSNRLVLSERNFFCSEYVTSVTFTCDGKRIVSGSGSGIVRMWDAAFASEEEQRSSGLSASVLSVSISPDGLRVATGSRDKTVRLWDSQTGAQIGIALEGHTDIVTCVSFSPDGRHLVSGSWDRTLRMWDTEAFTQIEDPFQGHSGRVNCVSFSCDGRRIVSGGDDKTVRLWNVETREQIGNALIGHALIGHVNRVIHVSESWDGRFVVSRDLAGREEGETIIWNRNSSSIVWRSNEPDGDANNRITSIEAESIIRSCGYETPHLWPSCFPDYTAELYCEDYTVYSTILNEKILVGNLPSRCMAWKYDGVAKVLAAALDSGGVAICRLGV